MDSASGSIRRSQHRRQPNDLVVPSATLSTVQSETEREAEAGTAESYFTAASPSIFPVPPTIVQPSITPNPVSPQASEKQSPENVVPEPPPTHPPTTNVGQPLASPPRNNTQHVHPYSQPNVTFSPRMHRFSLIKSGNAVKRGSGQGGVHAEASTSYLGGWSAFELLFGSAFGIGIGSRCDICAKRLGWKPCLECDDCGVM
jgi:LIM domain kinase 1